MTLRELLAQHRIGVVSRAPVLPNDVPLEPESPARLSWSCMVCGGHDYWQFSEAAGGGRACIDCHPLPLTLAREWELRTGRSLPPVTAVRVRPATAHEPAW